MLVSILIPNRNYASYLRSCVDSALAQTYRDVEVIVYDDGSTDGSQELLRSYGTRIQAILNNNYGKGHATNQVHAINEAYSAARGDIICLLDSDDEFEPGKVQAVVSVFQRWPGVVAVENYGCLIDSSSQRMRPRVRDPLPFSDHSGVLTQGEILDTARRTRFAFMGQPTSFLSFRRTFMQSVMPLQEDEFDACFVDLRLSALAPFHGDFYILREELTRYRVHGQNNFHGGPPVRFLRCMIQSCRYYNRALAQRGQRPLNFWTSPIMGFMYRHFIQRVRGRFKYGIKSLLRKARFN